MPLRWASDRIGTEGVVSFVSNAGWIDGNATDGLRKHLCDEFSKIFVFHLRGNQRTAGELSRREGGKIFGSGSRAPIAITVLVKNQKSTKRGEIFFHDIGDYLDRDQKLSIVKHFKSINGIRNEGKFIDLRPDENNDWINIGDRVFSKFISLGSKSDLKEAIFENYSLGVATNRDSWCYNFSQSRLCESIMRTCRFYSQELDRYTSAQNVRDIKQFIRRNPTQISWTRSLISQLARKKPLSFDKQKIRTAIYRPFTKTNFYFDSQLNEVTYQMPKIFSVPNTENLVIAVAGVGSRRFSCLMTDNIPCLDTIEKGQCFPLKLYERQEPGEGLFAKRSASDVYVGSDGISDEGLKYFQNAYPNASITKEDLFYYVYGLLHSPKYRERFQNNLSKEFPRIPAVKRFDDFKAFSDAGRKLGDLHVNFERVDPYPVSYKQGDLRLAAISDPKTFYRVQKMKFAGTRGKIDKSTVFYNNSITITNIPLEAYGYVVNGKSALDWVMERQCVKTDKDSGIVNDANDYANETMNNPAYPLELFQRVIIVSLETMKIVKALPSLDVD